MLTALMLELKWNNTKWGWHSRAMVAWGGRAEFLPGTAETVGCSWYFEDVFGLVFREVWGRILGQRETCSDTKYDGSPRGKQG